MQYMLLIYDNEKTKAAMADGERGAFFQKYISFTQSIRQSGAFCAGDPLQGSTSATTVRGNNGKAIVADGPFAETKEQLGGYYVVEAKDLDEAIAIAKRIPSLEIGGTVEVRPILSMGPPQK